MHFVTGGAYNGKRKWVRAYYSLESSRHLWLTAYETDSFLDPSAVILPPIVILEGLEHWINTQIDPEISADTLRKTAEDLIEPWLQWEKHRSSRTVVMIGCDISKGIVPIEKRDRLFRDVTGWVYQNLAKRADRADVIWYGIEQTIKNS